MNGAESLVKTLLASGVNTCFANPGTSEMHFVAALDSHPEMRCVLCLFEGGASGAADGYFRMKRDVAATMFHLAPGFGNAYANLHNARKGGSGILNVMGDHASRHLAYQSPLKGDTNGIAASVSHWVRRAEDASTVAMDAAAAICAARSEGGQIATLILPADSAWEAGSPPETSTAAKARGRVDPARIAVAAERLALPNAVLFIGGDAAIEPGLTRAGEIAAKTGARLIAPLFIPRVSRGAGRAAVEQLPYPPEAAAEVLKEAEQIVLLGADRPVNFFAYPGKPSTPEPTGSTIFDVCNAQMDVSECLEALADAVDARGAPVHVRPLNLPELPVGPLTLSGVGQALANLMPENSIVANESVTAGSELLPPLLTARPHELLITTGGAIGCGLPLALGAAVAAPERQVIALIGDGSAMYTPQTLWTMARERLNVLIIIVANRGYQILRGEMEALGVEQFGKNAQAMFDIVDPSLDWVALAEGQGVPARRVTSNEDAALAIQQGLSGEGPFLIEVPVS